MEKSNPIKNPVLLKILPAILGLASLVVPNLGFKYDGVAIWFFGVSEFGEEFSLIDYGKAEELIGVPIGVAILCVGSVLALLAAVNVLKISKLQWLPGVIMLAGVVTSFVTYGVAFGGEFLEGAPVVLSTACAAVGGVWSLVAGLKAMR